MRLGLLVMCQMSLFQLSGFLVFSVQTNFIKPNYIQVNLWNLIKLLYVKKKSQDSKICFFKKISFCLSVSYYHIIQGIMHHCTIIPNRVGIKEILDIITFSYACQGAYALSVASSLFVTVVTERTHGFVHNTELCVTDMCPCLQILACLHFQYVPPFLMRQNFTWH